MLSKSKIKPGYTQKLDFKQGCIEMAHGSGGRATAQLIQQLFVNTFDNEFLRPMNDQACFPSFNGRMVMSTDSHVVTPLFFPGGDIGSLAINGTINDIAMAGAKPCYLAASFILEEGLPLVDLQRIVNSMATSARAADVPIVTGDTKVVEKGSGDGVFITTTGIGTVPEGIHISGENARAGDKIIVSGTLGDHGIAVMASRENLSFQTSIVSDTIALHDLVATMIAAVPTVRVLRDPTRGGLASTLNEIAQQSSVGMMLYENNLPILEQVQAACEFLGLDPLYIANEGKLIAICPAEDAGNLLHTMQNHPLGRNAAIIGEVIDDAHCFVQMQTQLGGKRVIDWLSGEQLPRIC